METPPPETPVPAGAARAAVSAVREHARGRSGVVPALRGGGRDRGRRGAWVAGAAVSGRWARGAGGDRRDPGDRRAREPQRRGGGQSDADAVGRAAPPGATHEPPLATRRRCRARRRTRRDPTATPTRTRRRPDASPTATPTPRRPRRPSRRRPRTRHDGPGTGSTFPGWSGGRRRLHDHHRVGEVAVGGREGRAAGAGRGPVGRRHPRLEHYSSLNGGYQVVFTGDYTSKSTPRTR